MRNELVQHLAYSLLLAADCDPEGLSPAEHLALWEHNDESVIETPSPLGGVVIHTNVVLSAEERSAVLRIMEVADA